LIGIRSRHVVSAAYAIVNVLALTRTKRVIWVAKLDAEGIASHEVGPVPDLGRHSVVARRIALEGSRIHQTTKRIASLISSDGIHLSSIISCLNIKLCLVHSSSYLDIGLGLDELRCIDGSRRNDSGTMTR